MNILIYIAIGLAIANLCVITGIIAIVTRNWHISQKWSEILGAIVFGCWLYVMVSNWMLFDYISIIIQIVVGCIGIICGCIIWLFPPKEISYESMDTCSWLYSM